MWSQYVCAGNPGFPVQQALALVARPGSGRAGAEVPPQAPPQGYNQRQDGQTPARVGDFPRVDAGGAAPGTTILPGGSGKLTWSFWENQVKPSFGRKQTRRWCPRTRGWCPRTRGWRLGSEPGCCPLRKQERCSKWLGVTRFLPVPSLLGERPDWGGGEERGRAEGGEGGKGKGKTGTEGGKGGERKGGK